MGEKGRGEQLLPSAWRLSHFQRQEKKVTFSLFPLLFPTSLFFSSTPHLIKIRRKVPFRFFAAAAAPQLREKEREV
jgi:hypothetical protein